MKCPACGSENTQRCETDLEPFDYLNECLDCDDVFSDHESEVKYEKS